jgi:hypothetical protein
MLAQVAITPSMLAAASLGPAVRQLAKHADPKVARAAAATRDAWAAAVLRRT